MKVVTRFAPSPTGYLHIGGARTALFNWLFARHHGGKLLLRIEDTDRKRSTEDAIAAIFDGLQWLGLDWDGEAIHQFARAERHVEAVHSLLAAGKAYKCYCSPKELTEMRDQARSEGRAMLYDGRWRDRDASDAPTGINPVIRFKAPNEGETVINDAVQGQVRTANSQLDDMILLRADGTPTYMLSVVIDDHDMDITHVIRGDDHLTNAFRQTQLFLSLGWQPPQFAHIPLIHGADGAKLSKRHGALGIDAYRDIGLLPEAMFNYLLRLGWSHGDDEIISRNRAIEWFGLNDVGRSPARFDIDRLTSLNAHYMREADDGRLIELIRPILRDRLGVAQLNGEAERRVAAGLLNLKSRSKNLLELVDNSLFYAIDRPLKLDDKARKLLDSGTREMLRKLRPALAELEDWNAKAVESTIRAFVASLDIKLGHVAQPLRATLTGSTVSPSIFEVASVLGRDETLARLDDVT